MNPESEDDTYFDERGTDRVLVSSFSDIFSSVRQGNDLVVTFSPRIGSDTFRVVDHFAGRLIETIVAGNQTMVLATGFLGGDLPGVITGTDGKDTLDGRGGDDFLFGNSGKDRLIGGFGNDRLDGGAGKDALFGGEGNDLLDGGHGKDDLSGGAGEDVFEFASGEGRDVILDFTPGEDTIAFDRDSFGLAASASITEVLTIGGARPTSGAYFYITRDAIVFDVDWSNPAGRETVATAASFLFNSPGAGDFALV